jgi:serine phosphatase RsbU (regulator of sigma subunit)
MSLFDRFAATLAEADPEALNYARDYCQWVADQRGGEFAPHGDDDVHLRDYLLQLRLQGVQPAALSQRTAALKQFYAWALSAELIEHSPFDEFNFNRPYLSRDQIRRRSSALDASPQDRELIHLRGLNRLTAQLNRSPDVRSALESTLTTLVDVMALRTAWAFIMTRNGLLRLGDADAAPHDFALVAHCGLPPGLVHDNHHFLRRPPDCHCQQLLRAGRLVRAVNVVECTRLQNSAEADGDNQGLLFHASVPIWVQSRALGIINVATDDWQFLTAADLQFLTAVSAQLSIALERAQLYDELNAQRARLELELQIAREVQASLLPRHLPRVPGFSFAADWRSAREMAGDFYDMFALPEGRWALLIADVSDKGAPAAMYMAMTRSLIRASASRDLGPAATLIEVNRDLLAHSSSTMFVSVFYAVLDSQVRSLTYANAGHNPPLLRRSSGAIESLARTGVLVGILPDLIISEAGVTLAPGDTLVAYTDGLTDALNPQGEDYGLPRLQAALAAAPESDAALQLAHLSQDLAAFTSGVPPFDDITLFIAAVDATVENQ